MINSDTFQRIGTNHKVTSQAYNLILGFVLLWGFALNWWMVSTIPASSVKSINPIVFIIGYLVCAFVGSWLMSSSEKPVVSFIGYNLIVVPVGLVLVMALPGFAHAHIVAAVRTTALLTVGMMVLGTMYPEFFRKIESALFWALLIAIVVELVQVLIFKVKLGFMDWVIAAIFCGYIGVDWGRANSIERTVDNAIDSAGALYLDIVNLFIRVLEIIARNKD
jgi:FtsH-binding integral membrane protein